MTIKMLIYWTFPHLQATQYEFVSSSKEIWEKNSITSLAHQWILCSEWVPSEWESKQLIKTSKQPTPLQYTNILWREKLRVCMKQIHHWGILTLNHRFWLKQHSIIHYNIPSSEKVHSLLSTHIKIHQHFCLKLLMNILDLCIFIFWFNKMICFSLMKAILWIEKRFVKSILEDFFTLH